MNYIHYHNDNNNANYYRNNIINHFNNLGRRYETPQEYAARTNPSGSSEYNPGFNSGSFYGRSGTNVCIRTLNPVIYPEPVFQVTYTVTNGQPEPPPPLACYRCWGN